MQRPRIAVLALVCATLLAACSPGAGVAAPAPATNAGLAGAAATPVASPIPATPTATAVPSPTPQPLFAAGSRIADVDVGSLDMEAARARLRAELADLPQPFELHAGAASLTLEPDLIRLEVPLDALLEQASPALAAGSVVDLPLAIGFDEAALRTQMAILAERAATPPQLSVITSTETLSRSFAYTPGQLLDVDAAVAQVRERIESRRPGRTINLRLADDPTVPKASPTQLRAEVEALAGEWDGVVGFHLHDLTSDEAVRFHDQSVFAGASTIKVAIMLNAYVHLAKFSPRQEFWMGEMIRYSDNLSANDLLAAAAGGTGTEYAFAGAEQMSALLADDLGLENLYLYIPYEAGDYIKQNNVTYSCGPKDPIGEKPYTETGCALRANPYAIAQVYVAIDECARGEGVLLEKFERLNAARCQEMLDRLARNADKTRLVAGLPPGTRVEHKSGWIENMQADSGIVRTPGGDYVLAVYIYKRLTGNRFMWSDALMAPAVAAFSRLAYTAYNPIKLEP